MAFEVADAEESMYDVWLLHVVIVAHVRLDVAVDGLNWYWFAEHTVDVAHFRSDVIEGGTIWYRFAPHTVSEVQIRFDVGVGAMN